MLQYILRLEAMLSVCFFPSLLPLGKRTASFAIGIVAAKLEDSWRDLNVFFLRMNHNAVMNFSRTFQVTHVIVKLYDLYLGGFGPLPRRIASCENFRNPFSVGCLLLYKTQPHFSISLIVTFDAGTIFLLVHDI